MNMKIILYLKVGIQMSNQKAYEEVLESNTNKTEEQLKIMLEACSYNEDSDFEKREAFEMGLFAGSIYQTLIEREKAEMFDPNYFLKWRSDTIELKNSKENQSELEANGICYTGCEDYESFIVFIEGGFLAKRRDHLYELWINKETYISDCRDQLELKLYKFLCEEYA